MKSFPKPEFVLSILGDKVTAALGQSALLTKKDLLKYRREHPAWVAEHSERGLANWLHDRHWAHLVALLIDVEGVSFVDKEPIRDIYVGINYKMRIKRHHWDGKVSTYPTQAALEFMEQPEQDSLPGLEEVHLIAGCQWGRATRDITAAVLSLRDGLDKQKWLIELPMPEDDQSGTPGMPVQPTPKAPTIDTGALKKGRKEGGEGKAT